MPRQGLLFVCLLLALFGCARGYRKLGWVDSGYKDTQLDFSHYLVSYHGGNLEFCKAAAYYRAAELGEELGFTHFKVESEQVRSTFVARTHHPLEAHAQRQDYLVDDSSGLAKKSEAAGFSLKVEYFKADPRQGAIFEVKEILETRPVPGTKEIRKNLEQHDGK